MYHHLDTISPAEGPNTETKGGVEKRVWVTVRVRGYSLGLVVRVRTVVWLGAGLGLKI